MIDREFFVNGEHSILDYAPPPRRSSLVYRIFSRIGALVLVALVLVVAVLVLPHPEGIWYFGPRSQWVIAVEQGC
jgi:hypothetical protein